MFVSKRTMAMPDPTTDAELRAHSDRLRALEDQFASRHRHKLDDGFAGIREYSRAWHENRSTAYLLRKSFADPVSRSFFIVITGLVAVGLAYLLYQ